MNINLQKGKGPTAILFLIIGLFLMMPVASGQHNWTINEKDYAYSGEIDAVVLLNDVEVTSGTLGAFVDGECRGYVDTRLFEPTGKEIFLLLYYSNQASGEILTFKYYDDQTGLVLSVEETQEFILNEPVGSAEVPVQLHAVSNKAPVVDCPDYSSVTGNPGPLEFNLCDIFIDPEDDQLTYDIVVSQGSAYEWISACEIRFSPADTGTSTIDISADDGEYNVSCNYSFTTDPVNTAPQIVKPISLIRLHEGFVKYEINLDTVFVDAEDDALHYSAESSNEDVITVSVSNSILTIEEVANGSAEVTVTAGDGFLIKKLTFLVIVVSDGPPLPWEFSPEDYAFTGEVDAEVLVNSSIVTSGVLGAFVGDECRGIIEGSYFPPTGKTLFLLICNSNMVRGELMTFKYYNPIDSVIYNIREYVEFKPDMILGNAINPLHFNIVSENNIPIVETPISDKEADEHFASMKIELSSVFSDPDNDPLKYYTHSTDTSIVKVSVSGSILTITEGQPGTTEIIVSASDGALTIDDRFNFTISDINDPPVIVNPIGSLNLDEGFRSVAYSISEVFLDPEGDSLSFRASSSNRDVITVYISENDLVIREVAPGSATISLCASDGEFETCESISVTVININDPPEIDCNEVTDTSFVEGFGNYTIEGLSNRFSDNDDDLLSFSVSSSNTGVATVEFVDSNLVVTEAGCGSTNIEFCADDGEVTACCSFVLTVREENEIFLYYKGDVIENEDSLMICSDSIVISVNVQSNEEWSFITYSEWIQPESISDTILEIKCLENSTGGWRMGLIKIMDNYGHEALFYIHQKEDCIPDMINSYNRNILMSYPNPVSNLLNIEIGQTELTGNIAFSVVDIKGRIVMNGTVVLSGESLMQIDVSTLKKGFYYINISNDIGDRFSVSVVKN